MDRPNPNSMTPTRRAARALLLAAGVTALAAGCGGMRGTATTQEPTTAFVGARIIDGTGARPIENGVLLVQGGRIAAVGAADRVRVPANAERIDLAGRTVIPGMINAHGHVGSTRGLQSGPQQYTRENILDQLGRNARYGVTTVVSLGDDGPEGVRVRDEQAGATGLQHARLVVAGPVLNPATPEEAAQGVGEIQALGGDWVKFRVDSSLGTRPKMAPAVYQAIITEAHRRDLPVAVHIVELEDAKAVLRAGADLIAHSIRDVPVDDEAIALFRQRDVCLVPTLTRELSTFVYRSKPAFFDDPFFTREADPAVLVALQDPERQRRTAESASGQYFERQLPVARQNLKRLVDGGVRVAMGTDSGPAGRFQGFFEHLELEMMAEAGLTPMQILVAATGDAARCTGLDEVGTLERGKQADFVVLSRNPLDDIRNTRSIESVWIGGSRVPGLR